MNEPIETFASLKEGDLLTLTLPAIVGPGGRIDSRPGLHAQFAFSGQGAEHLVKQGYVTREPKPECEPGKLYVSPSEMESEADPSVYYRTNKSGWYSLQVDGSHGHWRHSVPADLVPLPITPPATELVTEDAQCDHHFGGQLAWGTRCEGRAGHPGDHLAGDWAWQSRDSIAPGEVVPCGQRGAWDTCNLPRGHASLHQAGIGTPRWGAKCRSWTPEPGTGPAHCQLLHRHAGPHGNGEKHWTEGARVR